MGCVFICLVLFVLILYVRVNSYGHVGTVRSSNHTFSLAYLTKFMHIPLQQPILNQRKEQNGRRNYFKINFQEIMGLGRDQTHDPWIYWVRYSVSGHQTNMQKIKQEKIFI